MHLEFKHLREIPCADIIALNTHPLVRRQMPLSDDHFDEEECRKWVEGKEAQWEEHGYGPWAFLVDGIFAGWGGFQHENGDADLGLVLHPDYWGAGRTIYEELMRRGFGEMGFPSVTILLPPSRRRIRGILKLGFLPDGEVELYGERFIRHRLYAPRMGRAAWLRDLRNDCEAKYDTYAPLYWDQYGLYSNLTHQEFIQEFLRRLPHERMILDAACGAGRYEPFLLEKGHSIIGIDQSQKMLERARGEFPSVQFEKVGLQEIAYQGVFDGVICMDAMENVPPEDWPLILGNFHRALKPGGYLYFTAETAENADEDEIKEAYEKAKRAGLPIVYGEVPEEEVYHYHLTNGQVRDWVRQAGFTILKEGDGEIWYHHVLARRG